MRLVYLDQTAKDRPTNQASGTSVDRCARLFLSPSICSMSASVVSLRDSDRPPTVRPGAPGCIQSYLRFRAGRCKRRHEEVLWSRRSCRRLPPSDHDDHRTTDNLARIGQGCWRCPPSKMQRYPSTGHPHNCGMLPSARLLRDVDCRRKGHPKHHEDEHFCAKAFPR